MIQTPMIGAAAMDLGLRASLEQDEAEKKRKQQMQQQKSREQQMLAPFSGAYMSLTGNQF
jgi:hypothetical protein